MVQNFLSFSRGQGGDRWEPEGDVVDIRPMKGQGQVFLVLEWWISQQELTIQYPLGTPKESWRPKNKQFSSSRSKTDNVPQFGKTFRMFCCVPGCLFSMLPECVSWLGHAGSSHARPQVSSIKGKGSEPLQQVAPPERLCQRNQQEAKDEGPAADVHARSGLHSPMYHWLLKGTWEKPLCVCVSLCLSFLKSLYVYPVYGNMSLATSLPCRIALLINSLNVLPLLIVSLQCLWSPPSDLLHIPIVLVTQKERPLKNRWAVVLPRAVELHLLLGYLRSLFVSCAGWRQRYFINSVSFGKERWFCDDGPEERNSWWTESEKIFYKFEYSYWWAFAFSFQENGRPFTWPPVTRRR